MIKESILVVDDNEDFRKLVRAILEEEGFDVLEAINGNDALQEFTSKNPGLIILDLSIGQPDGLAICSEIRKNSSVPIIVLTGRSGEIDEAMCLAAGADDFITKPVSARILALRVQTQLRHKAQQPEKLSVVLRAGVLELDLEKHEFKVSNTVVALTRTEYDFLRLLMENPKRVFSRNQVTQAIGGSLEFSSDHLLDTHASRLRQKVRLAGGPKIIHAIRGVGYRLQNVTVA